LTSGLPEFVKSSFSRLTQQGFQFGKLLFNRIQVRAIRRKLFQRRTSGYNQLLHLRHFMNRQMVADNAIAISLEIVIVNS
jgi:hypothetical protein